MSPMSRSIAKLKAEGWLVERVEHWNSYTHRRQDLFQFADLLAIKGDTALLVQTTSGSNASARLAKIQANPKSAAWLASPSRQVVVHAWARRGERGKRKLWTCREIAVFPAVGG